MYNHIGLLKFIRFLSSDRADRRRLSYALVSLIRSRSRTLYLLAPFLARCFNLRQPKLQLWQCLARCIVEQENNFLSPNLDSQLLSAIKSTESYHSAELNLALDRNGFIQRGSSYQQLRTHWTLSPPERVIIFHHYDRRGFLPLSWQQALVFFQSNGWQVVVSSSFLAPSLSDRLTHNGVQVVSRRNLGLCIGAYRDLALLLAYTPAAYASLRSIIFINDSCLLLHSPRQLLQHLELWSNNYELSQQPTLAGLTDSVERSSYHLQSFFQYANHSLLQHPAWLRFWLNFSVEGSKDELINYGEIGLSQALLSEGVILQASFPLIRGLLTDPSMADELLRYGINYPHQVNQSLFCWTSLIRRGFPLVKKHVLFDLVENHGMPMTISKLSRQIPSERFDLILGDLEQLLISRFSQQSS